jgi:hypothetical protein
MELDLIDYLENLRTNLNKSGVERTTGLKLSMGPTCAYYRKSKDIFLLQGDYDRIKAILLSTIRQIELVEGKSISTLLKEELNEKEQGGSNSGSNPT